LEGLAGLLVLPELPFEQNDILVFDLGEHTAGVLLLLLQLVANLRYDILLEADLLGLLLHMITEDADVFFAHRTRCAGLLVGVVFVKIPNRGGWLGRMREIFVRARRGPQLPVALIQYLLLCKAIRRVRTLTRKRSSQMVHKKTRVLLVGSDSRQGGLLGVVGEFVKTDSLEFQVVHAAHQGFQLGFEGDLCWAWFARKLG
jgi:hypothetical protein